MQQKAKEHKIFIYVDGNDDVMLLLSFMITSDSLPSYEDAPQKHVWVNFTRKVMLMNLPFRALRDSFIMRLSAYHNWNMIPSTTSSFHFPNAVR